MDYPTKCAKFERAKLLMQPKLIFALMAFGALLSVDVPSGAPGAAAQALPWHEPAVTISGPHPATIASGQFGADIINYDDMEWGADSDASYPSVALGMVRIWDDGTTWLNVEPSPGEWNFTALDRQVSQARSKGARVLYVLGQTPEWASSDPRSTDIYGRGAPAMPTSIQSWKQYVSEVAQRYKGEIGAYEIWDEADASTFSGTPEQMVELATVAYDTIKQIDPSAIVLTPSFTQYALTDGWLYDYLSDGGGVVANAFAGHAYANNPEGAATYLAAYRQALTRAGLKLPIWMTEIGYSGYSSTGQALFDTQNAQAYVARTLMDQAELGAAQIIWYGANTNDMWLSLGEQGYPADATAYTTMLRWLSGSTPKGCGGITSGPYAGLFACYLVRPDGATGVLMYDPQGTMTMQAPTSGSFKVKNLNGQVTVLAPGTSLTLTGSPVLVLPGSAS
ncbi:MAG: glycosyl hydrolase [Acidimicrobiales bacterium]